MNGLFDRRVRGLLERASRQRAALSKRAPFAELRIYSIFEDEAAVIYRPDGLYGARTRAGGLGVTEAFEKARAYQVPVYADMVFCCEWVYATLMRSGDYTEEQKARLHARSMGTPGVRKLCGHAGAEKIVDRLARVPQVLRLAPGGQGA